MNLLNLVTLSDKNKYIVVSKADYNKKIYVCLVDIKNNQNIKYCYLENDEIVEINKEDLDQKLLLKLARSSMKIDYNSLINN